jgi:hypothetical protein
MLSGTFLAVISPEGWLDPEAHESDLRGSRGVALAGALLIFMGLGNFRNTVRPLPTLLHMSFIFRERGIQTCRQSERLR